MPHYTLEVQIKSVVSTVVVVTADTEEEAIKHLETLSGEAATEYAERELHDFLYEGIITVTPTGRVVEVCSENHD